MLRINLHREYELHKTKYEVDIRNGNINPMMKQVVTAFKEHMTGGGTNRLLTTDYQYEQMIGADKSDKLLATEVFEGQMYNHHLSELKTEQMEALLKRILSKQLHKVVKNNMTVSKFRERITKNSDPLKKEKLEQEVNRLEDYWNIVSQMNTDGN